MYEKSSAETENHVDYDEVYYDDEAYFDDPIPQSEKGTNEVKIDDDSDCSHDKDSEEKMPDDSDDDGYNGYNGNSGYDGGYYYHDRRYERKTSPMMSPIISPVSG